MGEEGRVANLSFSQSIGLPVSLVKKLSRRISIISSDPSFFLWLENNAPMKITSGEATSVSALSHRIRVPIGICAAQLTKGSEGLRAVGLTHTLSG